MRKAEDRDDDDPRHGDASLRVQLERLAPPSAAHVRPDEETIKTLAERTRRKGLLEGIESGCQAAAATNSKVRS